MKKAVFLLLMTPIVWICLVTVVPLAMLHVPYIGSNCGSLRCAAGSMESFMMWTAISVLLIALLMGCAWETLQQPSRQKIVYIAEPRQNYQAKQGIQPVESNIHPR